MDPAVFAGLFLGVGAELASNPITGGELGAGPPAPSLTHCRLAARAIWAEPPPAGPRRQPLPQHHHPAAGRRGTDRPAAAPLAPPGHHWAQATAAAPPPHQPHHRGGRGLMVEVGGATPRPVPGRRRTRVRQLPSGDYTAAGGSMGWAQTAAQARGADRRGRQCGGGGGGVAAAGPTGVGQPQPQPQQQQTMRRQQQAQKEEAAAAAAAEKRRLQQREKDEQEELEEQRQQVRRQQAQELTGQEQTQTEWVWESEEADDVERRVDEQDGWAYTRAEFINCYGGGAEWDAAPRPTAGGASAEENHDHTALCPPMCLSVVEPEPEEQAEQVAQQPVEVEQQRVERVEQQVEQRRISISQEQLADLKEEDDDEEDDHDGEDNGDEEEEDEFEGGVSLADYADSGRASDGGAAPVTIKAIQPKPSTMSPAQARRQRAAKAAEVAEGVEEEEEAEEQEQQQEQQQQEEEEAGGARGDEVVQEVNTAPATAPAAAVHVSPVAVLPLPPRPVVGMTHLPELLEEESEDSIPSTSLPAPLLEEEEEQEQQQQQSEDAMTSISPPPPPVMPDEPPPPPVSAAAPEAAAAAAELPLACSACSHPDGTVVGGGEPIRFSKTQRSKADRARCASCVAQRKFKPGCGCPLCPWERCAAATAKPLAALPAQRPPNAAVQHALPASSPPPSTNPHPPLLANPAGRARQSRGCQSRGCPGAPPMGRLEAGRSCSSLSLLTPPLPSRAAPPTAGARARLPPASRRRRGACATGRWAQVPAAPAGSTVSSLSERRAWRLAAGAGRGGRRSKRSRS